MPKVAALLAAGILMSTSAHSAGSAGFEVALDNASVLGKGNAGVADPRDAATQIYNPAGLTQLKGSEIMASNTILLPNFEFKSASGTASDTGPVTPVYIPAFAMGFKTPIDKLTLGVSANSPYGLVTQYSSTGNFKYIGHYNQIQQIAYTVNAAYELTPSLSVSGGFSYADIDLKQNTKFNSTFISNANGLPGAFADAEGEWDLDGHGYGWNAALFWKATDRLSFGAMYRSQMRAQLNGELNVDNIQGVVMQSIFGGSSFRTSADTDITFPDSIVVGAAYDLTDQTTVELDLGWTGWSAFKQFNFAYGTSNAVLSGGNPARFGYDDTFSLNTGVTHKLNETWTVLGGYAYFTQASTETYYSNVIPDGDRHTVTTGLEYMWGKAKLSLAYAAQFTADQSVDNAVGNATANVSIDGEYDNVYHIVTTSLSYPLG